MRADVIMNMLPAVRLVCICADVVTGVPAVAKLAVGAGTLDNAEVVLVISLEFEIKLTYAVEVLTSVRADAFEKAFLSC